MCGETRMRVSKPPVMTGACHCRGCQRLSASAFSLTAIIPADGVEVIGETSIGALHRESKYEYCPHCLNWLLTRPAGMPFVNVRPTMFDAPDWATPFMETCVSEKLPWASTAAVHSFDRYPDEADYGRLMQDYAQRMKA